MKILLIDDHSLFRNGLRFLLTDLDESLEFFEAAGTARLGLVPTDIDLILLDFNLPGEKGVDAICRVRSVFAEAQVVVISGEENTTTVRACIDAGACGFIPKSTDPAVMIGALRLVLAGGVYLPMLALEPIDVTRAPALPSGSDGVSGRSSTVGTVQGQQNRAPFGDLQPRQVDALLLAIQGKSNKAIARELAVSEGTVKQYLSTAYRILGVSNRTEAAYAAAALGVTRQL